MLKTSNAYTYTNLQIIMTKRSCSWLVYFTECLDAYQKAWVVHCDLFFSLTKFKRMSHVTIELARWRNLTVQWSWVPSIDPISSPTLVRMTFPYKRSTAMIVKADDTHRCYSKCCKLIVQNPNTFDQKLITAKVFTWTKKKQMKTL